MPTYAPQMENVSDNLVGLLMVFGNAGPQLIAKRHVCLVLVRMKILGETEEPLHDLVATECALPDGCCLETRIAVAGALIGEVSERKTQYVGVCVWVLTRHLWCIH